MDWRERVTHVSEKVFPGLSQINPYTIGNEVISSLPLQMSLFFNITFLPVWLLIMIVYFHKEYNCFGIFQMLILIILITAITITEIIRLYLAYQGNLKDKISELAAFWLVSIILQVPLEVITIVNPYFNWQVTEYVVNITMSIMLFFQIIVGYFALKKIAHYQSTIFRILKTGKRYAPDLKNE